MLVFLVLWACHERLAVGTRVVFSVALDGRPVKDPLAYTATLGGAAVKSGFLARPGRRRFEVRMADTAPFERVLWIGYGTNDLGRIDLARTRAQLRLDVSPKPQRLELAGAYTVYNLTNASGLTDSVPVGTYAGRAWLGGFQHRFVVEVAANGESWHRIELPVGALELRTDPPGGRYRLLSILHRDVELAGQAPARIDDLPEGPYRLRAWRGDYARETNLTVRAGGTNAVLLTFEYGELRLNTTPSGAAILVSNQVLGRTPATLGMLKPGLHRFRLLKPGYFPVDIEAAIRGKGLEEVATNLTSYRYAEAMAAAQREATRTNYARALDQVAIALEESPGDPMASALKQQLAPLLQQERRQEAERQESQAAAARLRRPEELFERQTEHRRDAELFETQTLRVRASLKQVHAGLLRALAAAPAWDVLLNSEFDEDTVLIEARVISLVQGKRVIVVVAGRVNDTEVEIRFKIWDYVLDPGITPDPTRGVTDENFVALHPDRLKSETAQYIAARRQAAIDDFRARLSRELK